MKSIWTVSVAILMVIVVGLLVWLGQAPAEPRRGDPRGTDPAAAKAPLRIGLIPERDVFAQRKRYRAMADYLAEKMDRPVELVTMSTYEAILKEFEAKQVDAAFLGSLVAVMTMDRLGAQVLLKTEIEGGVSMYHGVVFVLDNSPVKKAEDLSGRSIVLLRTTTGGNLFPIGLMLDHGVLASPTPPEVTWVGTHDDVIRAVIEGKSDAGGIKDLVLAEFEQANPQYKFRRLGTSGAVPNNALIVRADVAKDLGPRLRDLLLGMEKDPRGREALEKFGAVRFLPCEAGEYKVVYDLIERMGPAWEQVGVAGPPPKRPAAVPNP